MMNKICSNINKTSKTMKMVLKMLRMVSFHSIAMDQLKKTLTNTNSTIVFIVYTLVIKIMIIIIKKILLIVVTMMMMMIKVKMIMMIVIKNKMSRRTTRNEKKVVSPKIVSNNITVSLMHRPSQQIIVIHTNITQTRRNCHLHERTKTLHIIDLIITIRIILTYHTNINTSSRSNDRLNANGWPENFTPS